MFKKCLRLNTSDFMEVFNFGKTIKRPLFLIKTKSNNLPFSRFAVVVSKKISKSAVERNHIRRRFMSALKDIVLDIPVSDYVFILNSGVKDIQYKDLISNLKDINL
jgi:ribonuclease P protein component